MTRAQESKLQIKGEQFIKKEKYAEAIKYFSELDSTVKVQDPLYNYYHGMAYYYSPNQKEKTIPHLQKYIGQLDSNKINYYSHQHVYYVLGKVYHLTYDFEKAKYFYNQYIELISAQVGLSEEEKRKIIKSTNKEIEQCKYGAIAVKNPRNVVIENLGDTINTIYPEYASVISQDETLLIFTSRRPDTQGGKKVPNEGYMEDIYKAEMTKGSLYEPRAQNPDSSKAYYFNLVTDFEYEFFQNLGKKINSTGHDGSIQLGAKDSLLYFYRNSDVWSINMYDDLIIKPTIMGVHVNSEQHEPSIFFSDDNMELFIVSDRPGGYGGLDIYVSKKDEGKWSEPKNMGPNINTEYDEDAPYLDPDGVTLYFASRGNSSIGEYDIFRSKLNDTTWSTPVNLGYPINTTSDDIYFTMTSRYNRGYYSSGRLEGKGATDLYRITFSDERDPIAELVGFVKRGDELVSAKSVITMKVINADESISTETDSINGDYFLLLGHGKQYEMSVNTENFVPYKKIFDIPEQMDYFQLYQEVHHVYLYNKNNDIIGQKITVYNAVGDTDSSTTYYDENTLKKFLLLKKKLSNDFDVRSLTDFETDSLVVLLTAYKSIKFNDEFDFRALNGYQIDSLLTLIENEITINTDDFNISSDVKFYITKDSLISEMINDPNLNFSFIDSTSISFINDANGDIYDLDSYTDYSKTFKGKDLIKPDVPNKIPEGFAITIDVKIIKGLFYTVQIGVYANPVTPDVLLNIKPLNSQITDYGNIRYTTGVFIDIPNASVRKDHVVATKGVVDAYVTAYYNGERITIAESKLLIEKEGYSVLFNSDANLILNRK
jgi:tetratricopeptide (TPR) repeat protein